ncbi:hypothetical protein KDW55_06145 [Burkholderia sp. AU19243]|uniref:hypothetical protein n=1 Tax=Burkholderia TaxID=32008 RepID=UPI0008421DD2|nr:MULTISPECIES: hypothetical protein [Burkholderia]MBR8141353.1 hypothetical protein [Burkholderia vietnamiensis]AOK07425.1 hypothetical protein WK25_23275 [Burkholderia latens]MBR8362902.1 hypothetical protein [Burkholderia sp. AU19243]MCA8309084.1 hypothetical protein [Burkholderia sp. AU28942]QTO51071.1 hypothetical protein J8I86_16610 [Burkholderia latens]
MRTQDIRLDAGQSHFAWFDKGSQVIVLDGTLSITLRNGQLDWLPDAPHYVRRVLDEGDCLTLDAAGHVELTAGGNGPAGALVAQPTARAGVLAAPRAWLHRMAAQLLGGRHVDDGA